MDDTPKGGIAESRKRPEQSHFVLYRYTKPTSETQRTTSKQSALGTRHSTSHRCSQTRRSLAIEPFLLAHTVLPSMAAVASPAAPGSGGASGGKNSSSFPSSAASNSATTAAAASASASAAQQLSRQIPIVCPGHTRPLAELQFCPVPASAGGGDEAERCLLVSACHGA
jgi:hypothetical protein